jgi:hypothetical protein
MRYSRNLGLLGAYMMATMTVVVAAEMTPLKQETKTAHYRLELQIGPPEMMYMPNEVSAKHPNDGEVMVGGVMGTKMNMSMGMSMGMEMPNGRHLEVHVYPLGKDSVVTNAKVKILVTDLATKKVQPVATAKMYGIKEGPSDTHYGNNVDLPGGNYGVEVTVNGEKADFAVAIPTS